VFNRIDLILHCLSSLCPVLIADISAGERVKTLVQLSLESPDMLFDTDKSRMKTSFIVSVVFHFRFWEYFQELLLLDY
jgi:hypothetical protein